MLYKVGNLEQVTSLAVDRTNQFLYKCGSIVGLSLVVSQVSPCWVYGKFLVLATAVYGAEVLVYHILALLRVRLHDKCLHLLYGQIQWDNLRDTEES